MKYIVLIGSAVLTILGQADTACAQLRPWLRPRPRPEPPPWGFIIPIVEENQYQTAPPPQATEPPPEQNTATINILLPSTANDIWVDGEKMPTRSTASRVFTSPPLEPGHKYVYTVRASWPSRDRMVTQERSVVIRANAVATVDFNKPPTEKKLQ
jgi:uncharacterized protein (TIGR03000 family)